jgi:hypothetical protein
MKGIRLTDSQVLTISKAFRLCFLPNDHMWLFGSRTDLNKRGGDIDLYIETSMSAEDAGKARIKFLTNLEIEIGEQKIDVVMKIGNFDLPIYEITKIDKLNKLEQLELLPSATWWMDLRKLRNILTHEYPDNPAFLADNLNNAFIQVKRLLLFWESLISYIENKLSY